MSDSSQQLADGIALLTRLHGAPVSAQALLADSTRNTEGRVDLDSMGEVLRYYGYQNKIRKRTLAEIPVATMPVLIIMQDGSVLIVTAIEGELQNRRFTYQDAEGNKKTSMQKKLQLDYAGYCWFIKPKPEQDFRSELPEYTFERAWFWKVIWRFKSYYGQVILASVLVNVLALIGSLYVMNVYDRVLPNKTLETLWALSIGVLLANLFEFTGRMVRARLTDIAGKKADLIISAALFRRVLALDLAQKPASAGSYANNLRDFESVRDFMTSASLLALVDLPFVLLYILVIWFVAGPLAVVPLVMIPLVISVGFLVQKPLAEYINQSMREGSQRQGLAVETIEGLETLKANNATSWAQTRWERFTAITAAAGMKVKDLSNLVVHFSQLAQQFNTVGVIVYGTYLIHAANPANRISMGALIATVILCGRALAPLSQIAGLMVRFQQTRTALQGLDAVVKRKIDRDLNRQYISLHKVRGDLAFENVVFTYGEKSAPVIKNLKFQIKAGEKVGVLGRIGSGKSTMLRLAAGLYEPAAGLVTLDDMDIRQIDPSDVRSHVTLFSQQPRLFMGTLRENLYMGRSDGSILDEDLLAALQRFGLEGMVRSHPLGLNMPIGEDGHGLSGGQKQMLCLARLALRSPEVVLLDEPTNGLDSMSEQFALRSVANWAQDRTLVVVTHRPQVLSIVDRIIVIEQGQLIMDGPRNAVLARLNNPSMDNEPEKQTPEKTHPAIQDDADNVLKKRVSYSVVGKTNPTKKLGGIDSANSDSDQ